MYANFKQNLVVNELMAPMSLISEMDEGKKSPRYSLVVLSPHCLSILLSSF